MCVWFNLMSNKPIYISNIFEDIYARVEYMQNDILNFTVCLQTKRLGDLLSTQSVEPDIHIIKNFLAKTNLKQVLLCLSAFNEGSFNISYCGEIKKRRCGDILVGFFNCDYNDIVFELHILNYVQIITVKFNCVTYAVNNEYPLYLLCILFTKLHIVLLKGDLNKLKIIYGYCSIKTKNKILMCNHTFFLANGIKIKYINSSFEIDSYDIDLKDILRNKKKLNNKQISYDEFMNNKKYKKYSYAPKSIIKYKDLLMSNKLLKLH